MKPSQFAKGFQARPDITTSEKRTALDRLNAIDGIVKSETPRRHRPNPRRKTSRRCPLLNSRSIRRSMNRRNIARGVSRIAMRRAGDRAAAEGDQA